MNHHHPPIFGGDIPGVDPASIETFRAFKRSMMLHRRLMLTLFAGEELHPAQAGCLQVLSARGGMSQSDLADMLHVSRPTVTTMLQRLEGRGAIERRPDENDSRVTRVYLTDEGRRLNAHLQELVADTLRLSVEQLPQGDRKELTRLLEKLNERIQAALAERGVSGMGHPHGHETGEL